MLKQFVVVIPNVLTIVNKMNQVSSHGPVHQFYKLGLNEAFFHSDSENLSHSVVSCSKLLKKAKTVTFAKDPKI